MSLLGIDVGTTGCKAAVFSEEGRPLSSAYVEYDIDRREEGWAELDAARVWGLVKGAVRTACAPVRESDPVRALSTSSMGEASVAVSEDRRILGPSILINDVRGAEYVELLRRSVSDEECYRISGNPLGNQYGLTKLMWLRDHDGELYRRTYKFLNWGSLVGYLLGARPSVDYCLANRDLLFDLRAEDWSPRLLAASGIEPDKLPRCVAPGSVVGEVEPAAARELGLRAGTPIVAGAHDQCVNALGCGVIEPGRAMYGMGTFPTIVPVYEGAPQAAEMLRFGLNIEHHAVRGRYVSFIYHMGGSVVKWYRETFAGAEHRAAREAGRDIYGDLFAELPVEPGPLLVLPHFAPMGPPDFVDDSSGVILGLTNHTTRGEILKAILEANVFALAVSVENLARLGMPIGGYTAVGGGSRSDAAVQLCADILGAPFVRPKITEAGALGAALLAGMAVGVYASAKEAVGATVEIDRTFDPDPRKHERYRELFGHYLRMREALVPVARAWRGYRAGRS